MAFLMLKDLVNAPIPFALVYCSASSVGKLSFFQPICRKYNVRFFYLKKVGVHLCPPVKGRILENGQPVASMKVLRQLVFNGGDVLEDSVITDANGEFTMPEKVQRVAKRKISITANVTAQLLTVNHDGEKYRLWRHGHHGIKADNTIIDKLNHLNCELTDNEVYFLFDYQEDSNRHPKYERYGTSICRWENDFYIDEI